MNFKLIQSILYAFLNGTKHSLCYTHPHTKVRVSPQQNKLIFKTINIGKLTCIELHIENTYYYYYYRQQQEVKDYI